MQTFLTAPPLAVYHDTTALPCRVCRGVLNFSSTEGPPQDLLLCSFASSTGSEAAFGCRAVAAWRQQKVGCTIHFGDVLDGFHPKAQSLPALKAIVSEFESVGRPHYHMIGNHCLYNLPRPVLVLAPAGWSDADLRSRKRTPVLCGKAWLPSLQVLNQELRMGTAASASYYHWCACRSWLLAD